MRKHTKGGYANVLDELWVVCKQYNADMVLMYDQISCKGMDGLRGVFEEQAAARGVHMLWVAQDLLDSRTISKRDMRRQVNLYMQTVMGEEPVRPDLVDFDDALLSVQQGKADIVMAGVTVTDERKAVMDFSDSYATGIQSIIVPEGSDIATADDLSGKAIGTQRGTTGYLYCTDDFGEENVIAYDDGLTAVQALNNGQVDAVVIDNAPAQEFVAANPGLKILDTSYAEEDYAIGMNKSNTALLEAVNAALEELKADGTLQSIVDKYITAE